MVMVMVLVMVMMVVVVAMVEVVKKASPSKLSLNLLHWLEVEGANQACTSRESDQITISQCKNTLLRIDLKQLGCVQGSVYP